MIVITSNEKLKEETFIHHHLLQLKLPFLQGEFCPHQIIQIIFFTFFFCNQTDEAVNHHQFQTLSLDKRERKMAQGLVDTKLLAKFEVH